jgi:hypothetical protein
VETKRFLGLVIIAGNLAFSIAGASFSAFHTTEPMPDPPPHNDQAAYLRLYFGEPVDIHQRYRLLVPYLARFVPLPDTTFFFRPGRPVNAVTIAALKFGIVNLVFLTATAVLVCLLSQGFGLSFEQGLLGSILFLSSYFIVLAGGIPLTEPGYFFFLALGVHAIQRRSLWLLTSAATIGVWANEQVGWLLLFVVLAPYAWSERMKLASGVLPVLIVYVIVRVWIFPPRTDYFVSGYFLSQIPAAVRYLFTPFGVVRVLMTFGLLWIPCAFALLRCKLPPTLARWSWFIPAVFVLMLSIGGRDVFRLMTVTFPVAIPLALIGLDQCFGILSGDGGRHKAITIAT